MTLQNIDAQSPEAKSADLLADNIARLRALFPELVTESSKGVAINVDVLKSLVGDVAVTDADEKYGLNWHGKRRARQIALTPSTANDLKTSLFDHLEHLEPGRSADDILYEVLLKLGLDLCVPIEPQTIAGKRVHSVGGGVLMACLAEDIKTTEAEALALGMAAWREALGTVGDTTAVFRDNAFQNDVAKSNLAAILEQHGIKQVRSL
jgi:hypothetical protein